MIRKSVLPNGIRVITEDIPHAYSVSVGIWVANGTRHEPRSLNGIAHFIEHLLFKGTERRNALDIAREIDSVGGVLNAFTSREYVCYYAKVLHNALPRVIDLLSDIFLNSVFDHEEIEKERRVILQEISRMEDSPDDYIHDLFSRNFWKDHPLGMPILGNEESVSSFSRDGIFGYKNEMYRAGDIIITAAGQVKHKELLKLLNGAFAKIPAKGAGVESPAPAYEKRLEILEKELEQTHICLGTKSLPQNHQDRFACYILNSILGGSMSSRLFQEIREKKGLVYSVYSYISAHADAGSLVLYAGTGHEKFDEVLSIVLHELKSLKDEPVSLLELDSAREQIKGNILLSLESSDSRMSKLAKNEIYFGRDISLEEIMAGFDAVTPEKILQLAGDLFNEQCFTLEVMSKPGNVKITPSELTLA